MRKIADGLSLLAITAWAGGLWGIGYIAVPVLFQTLPDRMLAGLLAGKMFTLMAWVGIAAGGYLLAYYLKTSGGAALKRAAFLAAAAMLLITLAMQFGIQPVMAGLKAQAAPLDVMHSELAGQFRMLHGVSSILYLVQSLLGVLLVLKSQRN